MLAQKGEHETRMAEVSVQSSHFVVISLHIHSM